MSSVRAEPNTNPIYEAAEQYVRMGISVIPIKTGTKEPPTGFRWGEFVQRMSSADERYEWFVVQGHQLAVIAGKNLVPLDFDTPDGFDSLARQHDIAYNLPRVRTGSGSHHVWVRPSKPTAKYNTQTPNGGRLEVRAGTHYTLAPPSIHPNGEPYVWEVEPLDGIPTIDLESIGLRYVSPEERDTGEPIDTEGTPLTDAEIDHIIRILTPHWIPYSRHDIAMYVSGWLASHSVPIKDAGRIITTLAEEHGDDDRLLEFKRAIRDTYRKARKGVAVGGWSKLCDRDAPLISSAAANELDLLMRGRNPVFTFDVTATVEEPAFPYIISVADLLKEPDEPERWLVDNFWRDQTIGLIVGPPKTMKSFLAIEIAVAIASGTPMFGMFHVPEPQTVVYVQEESARRYVRKRFAGVMAGRGIHPAAVEDTLYTITNQRFRLDDPQHVQRLITEAIEAYRPSLVILDPLREMHWQDENKAETMMPMLRVLKDMRDTYGVSIAVVHHNNKNPEYTNPADSIRGSGAIWAAMDAGVFIGHTSDDDQMKVSVVLKEGGQVDPFLFSLDNDGEDITFKVVEVEDAKKSISDTEIIQIVARLGGWNGVKEISGACSMSIRRIQPRLNALAARGQINKKTGKAGKLLYAVIPEEDDEPTF